MRAVWLNVWLRAGAKAASMTGSGRIDAMCWTYAIDLNAATAR